MKSTISMREGCGLLAIGCVAPSICAGPGIYGLKTIDPTHDGPRSSLCRFGEQVGLHVAQVTWQAVYNSSR